MSAYGTEGHQPAGLRVMIGGVYRWNFAPSPDLNRNLTLNLFVRLRL
jgi:hypothetical protein